jgi:serine/threonine-protein kinase PpkA
MRRRRAAALSRGLLQALVGCLALALLLTASIPCYAAEDPLRPLRLAGKKTLYERVLSRVGATLHERPDPNAAEVARVPPFSIYYVYARRLAADGEWVQVGSSSDGSVSGWIPARQLVAWKQMLVGIFTRPGNRYPALLFRDRDTLLDLLESELGASQANRYREQAVTGDAGTPVVAIEPETYIDSRENFYLLPILDHFQADDDFVTKALNVAVVNADLRRTAVRSDTTGGADPMAGFKVATTFVIDTTLSMGPYIEQTRDAIRRICEKTQDTPWRDRFNFAIVAFRDSLAARPELEYTWRRVADFRDGRDCQALLDEAGAAAEARVSSKGFVEDAFAGVNGALTDLDWGPFGGRYLVLITDASARSGTNRYSSTGLNAEQLRSKARDQGVAILTLHLLTPEGRQDHERAADQYTTLSSWPNVQPFYFPLPAGAEEFGRQVEHLADALIGQLGKDVASHLAQTQGGADADPVRSRHIDQLGHAMRLAYLGRIQGTTAPEVFSAWVAERNVEDRRKLALQIRVLLTKDELSDLQTALRQIVEAGDLTDLAPEDFFTQVRKLLIVAQRDSAELARARSLGDSVVLGEFLDGLPYRSALSGVDQEAWLAMGAGERQEIIDDIEAKIQLYQDIHDDPDLWVSLDDGHSKGDAVYPLPLTDLP